MAPESAKSRKKSTSSSQTGKKSGSILDSMLHGAFNKDESSSSKSSKLPKGKDAQERTKSEMKDHHLSTRYAAKKPQSSSSKEAKSKPSESTQKPSGPFLSSEFFNDESQAPPLATIKPLNPCQPSQQPVISTAIPDTFTKSPEHKQHSKTSTIKDGSVQVTEKDKERAKKQLKIETLSGKELEEQETWALEKLIQLGPCPQNWGWERYTAPVGYEQYSGYRCCGSPPERGLRHVHMISHELLAEGKGGYYKLSKETNWWDGPFYPVHDVLEQKTMQVQKALRRANRVHLQC